MIIKAIGKRTPNFINRLFVYIPFKYRHGRVYTEFEKLISESKEWDEDELENYVVTHFNRIFQHAKKFKLYKEKYKKSGVYDLKINCIDDIKKIPILTRKEIRNNIQEFKGFFYEKTGGTSGNPLHLYLDKNIWAREWAHYHNIWSIVDYKYTDAKFVFKRENTKDKFIKYDFNHNEYLVNTYNMSIQNVDYFFKTLITKKVKYFHGYPSSIYDFLKFLEVNASAFQKKILQAQIKCCFLSSETPLAHIINYIRNVWEIDFLACYGHTEACVLASADINNLHYSPLHTYGYIEEENNLLLGTSYHNFDMPLIRYNTDDLIRANKYKNGVVKSFLIKEGRILDYFFDKNELKIYYLDLFEETDGEIFNYIEHLQFYQNKKGYVTLLISQRKYKKIDVPSLLNFEKFNVDFDLIFLKEPIRTKRGKVLLKVNKLPN